VITRRSVVFIALLLAGCVHKYAVPETGDRYSRIPSSARVYVAEPMDGQDDRPRAYEKSGRWTRSAVVQALRGQGVQLISGEVAASQDEAMELARAAGAGFLVYPEIRHWSDRATEWSGVPDRITLDIRIYDVSTGSVINRQKIRASSRWATFGGDHPQELLPELTRRWAESVVPSLGTW